MAARKYDYIIIYSILFASILSIAVLVRLLVISELNATYSSLPNKKTIFSFTG